MKLGIHESVEAVFPPAELQTALTEAGVEAELVGDDPIELGACDGVVTFAHREYFFDAVEWVHSIQAGVDRFPQNEFEAEGLTLTNSTGIHGASVGETVLGYMTAFARNLHAYRSAQDRGEWIEPDWDRPFTLEDESVCVVGLGTIGQAVAERATWLGMDVWGVRRSPDPVPIVDEVYGQEDLHTALLDATFVVLAVPLTPATRRLIGPAELAAMDDDAYLINVARGSVVVQDALVSALENDDLAGAALDVFQEEPLPADSPLWELDEVIVTPHSAARTRDYFRDIAEIVLDNVERLEEGRTLRNQVV
ncbi:2-D-hydroxyacid dehydrogenase [Salinarchaeum sp. Harcht-Bsk1]|uniref:D-2-hydroxyacid dehydrogenase n=1 Tax=Salinarchaeum sp. Harcht-Bsk1 TaxID=1333523 RepID=UPI00034235FD|nr:D-2-hydroxyacid dehydrogenase [Salinarchaeum sp. Harcht-Bsk1]AGN01690.1 2-D-hydroxyacid dehydrogenase [Salinarchaeum sp. Harcht-Bsk1]